MLTKLFKVNTHRLQYRLVGLLDLVSIYTIMSQRHL